MTGYEAGNRGGLLCAGRDWAEEENCGRHRFSSLFLGLPLGSRMAVSRVVTSVHFCWGKGACGTKSRCACRHSAPRSCREAGPWHFSLRLRGSLVAVTSVAKDASHALLPLRSLIGDGFPRVSSCREPVCALQHQIPMFPFLSQNPSILHIVLFRVL